MKNILKAFNKMIKILFSLLMKFLSSLYINSSKIFKIIKYNERNRSYRLILLRETFHLLRKILLLLKFDLPVVFHKDRIIFDLDGVKIEENNSINRYYKIFNTKYHNEAKYLEDLFDFSKAKCFVDIGSCIGEYTIYFAKKYPLSKVYSIEPNDNNLKLLKKNIKINKIDNRVKVIENAISNIKDQNYHTKLDSQKSEVIIQSGNSEKKTITLSSLISEEKLNKIDFLKIDIEGSNYKVAQCIADNVSKIDGLQYEFNKGPANIFLYLIDKLNNFYDFYILENEKFKKIDEKSLKEKIKIFGDNNKSGVDVYFKKNRFL